MKIDSLINFLLDSFEKSSEAKKVTIVNIILFNVFIVHRVLLFVIWMQSVQNECVDFSNKNKKVLNN
jgi:hypothetical protein